MAFASPLWLLALIPWAAVAIWLFTGQRQRAAVPFLNLWRGPDAALPRSRAALQVPPIAVFLMMIAMLLAILGAAGPRIGFITHTQGPKITIIVDRGMTMSARGKAEARWKELAELVHEPLLRQFGAGAVDLILAPDGKVIHTDRSNWSRLAIQENDANVQPKDILPQLAVSALRNGPVIVLSDQTLEIEDPNLVQIPPQTEARNVGIVMASVRETPRPQVLVRVRNDSDQSVARLLVDSASQQIDLPGRGQERNYFVDLNSVPTTISIELTVEDDLPADNRATIQRQRSWPRIEPAGGLPAEVVRVIESYEKLRISGEESALLLVTTASADPDQAAVTVSPSQTVVEPASPRVETHDINANLNWSEILESGPRVAASPGTGWRPIVSMNQQTLVAVRDSPARQVWVGFGFDNWPRTSEFVIFWSNVLDWAGMGQDQFVFRGISAIPIPPIPHTGWQEKLSKLPGSSQAGSDISLLLLAGAVGLIFLAKIAWGGLQKLRPPLGSA